MLPHVVVARTMRRKHIAVKANDVVPYIICKSNEPNRRTPHMPEDVIDGKAEIGKITAMLNVISSD